jgi:hypothetical protein
VCCTGRVSDPLRRHGSSQFQDPASAYRRRMLPNGRAIDNLGSENGLSRPGTKADIRRIARQWAANQTEVLLTLPRWQGRQPRPREVTGGGLAFRVKAAAVSRRCPSSVEGGRGLHRGMGRPHFAAVVFPDDRMRFAPHTAPTTRAIGRPSERRTTTTTKGQQVWG